MNKPLYALRVFFKYASFLPAILLSLLFIQSPVFADTAPNYLETILDELKNVKEKNSSAPDIPVKKKVVKEVPASVKTSVKEKKPEKRSAVKKTVVKKEPVKKITAKKVAKKEVKKVKAVTVAKKKNTAVKSTEKTKKANNIKKVVDKVIVPHVQKTVQVQTKPEPVSMPESVKKLSELPMFDLSGSEADAIQQFEDSMRITYPGSYYLMRRLPADEKRAIFLEYKDSGDIVRVRKMILEFVRSHW